MISYHDHVTYVKSDPAQAEADANAQRIETLARALANAPMFWGDVSEPDRAYWRRKAKIAIQVIKDLTT